MHKLTLDLPPETMEAVRRLAEKKGSSATDLMTIAIDELIATTEAERRSDADEQPRSTAT